MTWVVEQTAEKLEKLDAKAAKEEKEEQKEAQLQDALAVTIPKNVTTLPHAGSQMVLSMLQALNRRKEFVASEVGFTYSLLFTFQIRAAIGTAAKCIMETTPPCDILPAFMSGRLLTTCPVPNIENLPIAQLIGSKHPLQMVWNFFVFHSLPVVAVGSSCGV